MSGGRVRIAKFAYLISSAAVLLLGILLLIFPDVSVYTVSRIVGAVMLILGAVKLYGYFSHDLYRIAFQFDLAFGVLTIILGFSMLVYPAVFSEALYVILSVFVIIDSVFTVQNSLEAKMFGIKRWWLLLIGGILAVLMGGIALAKSFDDYITAMQLIGAAFIADGIQNVIAALLTVHYSKKLD